MLYRHAFLFMGFVSADQVDPDDQYDYVYEETKYEGVCVLSHNHKDTPSPEPLLNGECRQWRNNSCCMPETNTHLFGSEARKTKFQHNHCGEMTEQCLVLMYRQWCLYQCDPYLEPWIINRKEPNTTALPATTLSPTTVQPLLNSSEDMFSQLDYETLNELSIRVKKSHRLSNVPLCRSDCDYWWNACKQELTCTNNWYDGFEWEMGIDGSWHNVCKNTTDACKPISSWFSSSQEFCEGIFQGDYQVVDQKDICISFMNPEHNYNASKGHNSRPDQEEWIISGAVIFSLTVLIVGAVFLVRSNTCRQVLINIRLFQLRYAENQEQVTQSLATEDELSREALA